MSDPVQLVPVSPAAPIPAAKQPSLSPALLLRRFHPLHVVEAAPGETIYYLVKDRGAKSAGSRRWSKESERQTAMLTARSRSFDLFWYPHDGEPEIHKGLPLDRLAAALEDLWNAGFR